MTGTRKAERINCTNCGEKFHGLTECKPVNVAPPVKLEWRESRKDVWMLGSHLACIWLDSYDQKWSSNTPPMSGAWSKREDGQAALVEALRKQYTEMLAQLPEATQCPPTT